MVSKQRSKNIVDQIKGNNRNATVDLIEVESEDDGINLVVLSLREMEEKLPSNQVVIFTDDLEEIIEKDSSGKNSSISLRSDLKPFLDSISMDSLCYTSFHLLQRNEKQVSFAESCTGGLVQSELCKIAGSSKVFWGGYVVYSNEAKQKMLGVSQEILSKYGAVSRQCVEELLYGLIRNTEADFVGAISGIAGPSGGTAEKPVGTVVLGLRSRSLGEMILSVKSFEGDRISIQNQAAKYLLLMLINFLT